MELVEEILPINYYSELAGVIIDTTMVNEFLKKYFPVLGDFFTRNDFSVNNFVHKWLVTIFLENFKEDTTFLIWDFLFLEGNIVLIKTCLIVFCILKRKLLQNENNFEELFIILSHETNNILPNNPTLLHGLSLKQFEFTEEYLESTRDMLGLSIMKNIDDENKEKFEKRKHMNQIIIQKVSDNNSTTTNNTNYSSVINCDISWPICFREEAKEKPITVKKFLILSHKTPPQQIENYFFNSTNNHEQKNSQQYYDDEKDIIIERHKHCCVDQNIQNLKSNLKERIKNIIESKENENKNANISDKDKDKELIYRRMSTKKEIIEAREIIKKSFKVEPYKEEDFSYKGKNKNQKKK